MAITDREGSTVPTGDPEALAESPPAPVEGGPPTEPEPEPAPSHGRVLLAVLSAAAGVIHLALVPSHASGWLAEGIAFAIAGWVQIGLAVLLLERPSRAAVRTTCLLNVVLIAAWSVTRIWGWPIGPEAGVAHPVGFADLTCVAFEAALVVLGSVVLVKPDAGRRLGSAMRVALSIAAVGVVVLATAAIASPSATDHPHEGAGALDDHDHGGAPGAMPADGDAHDDGGSGAMPPGGHDHATPGAMPAAGDGHDHGAPAAADDKGLSQIMNGAGEGGGHLHSDRVEPLDAATQQRLDAQLAKMQLFIEKFPTVRAAEAAGYQRQGPYSPGLGAHYSETGRPFLNTGPDMTDEALAHPMLIFDGVEPDAKLAGFMYNIFSLDEENPPEGFAGPNDHWHYHTDVCITVRPGGGTDAPLGADSSATKEMCDKFGGVLIPNTGYMVHVWPVPGYESPQGLFSNLNARLTCPNGTYYVVPQEEIGIRSNMCKDVPH